MDVKHRAIQVWGYLALVTGCGCAIVQVLALTSPRHLDLRIFLLTDVLAAYLIYIGVRNVLFARKQEKAPGEWGTMLATLAKSARRRVTPVVAVAMLFAALGFAGADTAVSYSKWVAGLYAQNRQISYEVWYQRNVSLTQYADRQWVIWWAEFPVSMSLAIVLAIALGWVRNCGWEQVLAGVGLLVLANCAAVVVFLAAVGLIWALAFVPMLAANAYFVALAHAALTSNIAQGWTTQVSVSKRARRFFRRLLLRGVPCGLLPGIALAYLAGSGYWAIAGIQVAWGVMLGMSLAPAVAPSAPRPATVPS